MPAQDSQGRYVTPSESPSGAQLASAARTTTANGIGGTDTPSFTFAISATADRDA